MNVAECKRSNEIAPKRAILCRYHGEDLINWVDTEFILRRTARASLANLVPF